LEFTTLKNFRKAFVNGLSEGIKVRLMNEENIDIFCELMQAFFETADNDFWLNRVDSGIYQIEKGATNPLLIVLVTPGLVQFRLPKSIKEFEEIDQTAHHDLSTGALGVFAFIGIFEGDIDFETDFVTEEVVKEEINKQKKSDDNEPWLL
jgi:hypothetical protein